MTVRGRVSVLRAVTDAPFARRVVPLAALLLAAASVAQAQSIRPDGGRAEPLPIPGLTPSATPLQSPFQASPSASTRLDAASARRAPGPGEPAVTNTRNQYFEGEIAVQAGVTDRAFLDASPKRKEATVIVSPRLTFHSRGPQVRLNATAGVDSVTYVKDTNADYVQPVVRADVQARVIDNLAFIDASANVDRRPASAYAAQSSAVATNNQLRTGVYRFTPRLEHREPSGWNSLLRSDNIWTKQSGAAVGTVTQAGDSYSQNTEARIERVPERFGFGLEGSRQELSYDDAGGDVIRLESARATAGYAVSNQFTGWLLAGVERTRFFGRSDSDSDYGFRIRWAPLERSVVTAEVRQRFFGTGFNVQWDHRHRNFGLTLGASREPNTQPEAVQLAGNLGEQFDAIYRARGYTEAQREALVRASLNAYGLPANLADPVNIHVNRPQLNNTGTALLSVLGRRSVFVVSTFYRKLVALRRDNDLALAPTAGDLRQVGGQASLNFRLTPLSSVDALYRINDTRGLGVDAFRSSREQVWSIGTSHSLSQRTQLTFVLQHQSLDTTDLGGPVSASANSAGLGLNYRF